MQPSIPTLLPTVVIGNGIYIYMFSENVGENVSKKVVVQNIYACLLL